MKITEKNPAAVVLARSATGLGTVRALASAGIEVHALVFNPEDPIRFSRCCTIVHVPDAGKDEARLLAFLQDYLAKFDAPPVVFPSCDEHALFLAKHVATLQHLCRVSSTDFGSLKRIICKDGLHRSVVAAGLATVPSLIAPTLAQVEHWSRDNPAPYLIKPFYAGMPSAAFKEKNVYINSRARLLKFVGEVDTDSLVIQRVLKGGDGYILDCYGYCDRDGKVLAMASHRRLRQAPSDFGATSFGVIPATIDPALEARLFDNTLQLLRTIKYHGIFGIEWLHERDADNLYAIDFNARPFLTVGHLSDCGLNLPALAYLELIGRVPSQVVQKPALKSLYWVELLADLWTYREKLAKHEITTSRWLGSLIRSRSFAFFSWRDPGPGIARTATLVRQIVAYGIKRLLHARDVVAEGGRDDILDNG